MTQPTTTPTKPTPQAKRPNSPPSRMMSWAQVQDYLPYLAFLVLLVVFAVTAENFLSAANVANLVRQGSVLMVIAAGATLVVVAGSVDLSVGAVATLCGTLGAVQGLHGHHWVLWTLPLVGALLGSLNGLLVAVMSLPSFLVTLGTLFIFAGIASRMTQGASVSFFDEQLDLAINDSSILGIPNIGWWALLALLITCLIAYKTSSGRKVYAIGGNESVARLAGVNVKLLKVLVFTLSGFSAGAAGLMLLGRGGGSSPVMGDPFLLSAIAAIVMGGTSLSGGAGGPGRTVLGVAAITVLANGMTLASVNPYNQNVVFGVIVILAVAATVRRGEMGAVK
jgi:ribose transport system permease protein